MKNIAEILKNAPTGLKLYSLVDGDVELVNVNVKYTEDYPIKVYSEDKSNFIFFDEYGKVYKSKGECVLFPSKSHQTWDNWQEVLIPKCVGSVVVSTPCICDYEWIVTNNGVFAMNMYENDENYQYSFKEMSYKRLRFANPKETEVFFERLDKLNYGFENGEIVKKSKCEQYGALKDNSGLCIDMDCQKKYEKPFKDHELVSMGDFVFEYKGEQSNITAYAYALIEKDGDKVFINDWCDCDDSAKPATPEEHKWFWRTLVEKGYIYDNDNNTYKKTYSSAGEYSKSTFTIKDFKPFDKVLVRDTNGCEWTIDFYSAFIPGYNSYQCMKDGWLQCLPYNEDTKHLLGTTASYNGKYRTWK